MLKGWSLIGDALGHAVVPGVAGAYMLGLPFSVGAFFAGWLAALAWCSSASAPGCGKTRSSASSSPRSSRSACCMVSLNPTAVNMQTIVMGNILGISDGDTLQVVIISVVSLADPAAQMEGPDAGLLR